MNKYLLTYELSKPFHEYEQFYKAISSYEEYIKLFSSAYIITTNSLPKLIVDNLSRYLNPDDKLCVIKIDDELVHEGFNMKIDI
jgi:hypothetical protein